MPSRKTRSLALAAILAGASAGVTACGDTAQSGDSQVFEYSGDRLTIDTGETSVVIENGEAGKISVERTLKGSAAEADGATLTLSDGVLKAWVNCGRPSVYCAGSHAVHVPPGIDIDLVSSGGQITGRSLTGEVNAAMRNDASLSLVEPSGVLNLDAKGGGISVSAGRSPEVSAVASADAGVSLVFAAPPNQVEARSIGGNADVVLPAGPETYRISVSGATSGGIASDPASARAVVVESTEGRAFVQKAG